VPNGNPNRRPIDRLCDQLADRGLLTRVPQTFDFELPVWKMKGRQIDNRVIRDSSLFIHDAHGAALGVFELLLVVAGDVNPLPDGSHQVIVRKKGVFMEDQYDFEGDQSFGYWNIGNHTASTVPNSVSYCPEVTNETFRRWREENNRGGDYFVYSDLRQVTLTTPYVFYCPTGPGPV
jgi:hypothetical protein